MFSVLRLSTVNDVSGGRLNMTGLIVAAVSVVSSGMQQILCGVFQRKHGISSNQMLANTAPMQVRQRGWGGQVWGERKRMEGQAERDGVQGWGGKGALMQVRQRGWDCG